MLSPMAEKKKQQEVPDELPSLAEDILKEEEGVKQEEGGIPEELPPLDDELLGELEGEASAELSPPAPKGQKPVDSESYFGSLVKDLEKNPRIPHDFLSEMKTFWKGHGVEEKPLDTEIKTSYELDLDKDVQEKVRQLQALESQWKQQKDGLERARLQVENTEIEITLRSEELKKLLSTLAELRIVFKDIKRKIEARNVRLRDESERSRARKLAAHRRK